MIALAGYLSDETPGWPPPYAKACEEQLESLGTVIRVLDIDAEQYAQLVELTRKLLANEHFVRLRDSIARALTASRGSSARTSRRSDQVHGFPIPEHQEQPCNT